jgi:hypothetical protein
MHNVVTTYIGKSTPRSELGQRLRLIAGTVSVAHESFVALHDAANMADRHAALVRAVQSALTRSSSGGFFVHELENALAKELL